MSRLTWIRLAQKMSPRCAINKKKLGRIYAGKVIFPAPLYAFHLKTQERLQHFVDQKMLRHLKGFL